MKIIGKTDSSGGFLVIANETELCQIMGHGSPYGLKEADKPAIGKEIKVSPLWQALSASRDRKVEVAALADGLRKLAGRIDSINQALAAPIVEVEVTK